MNIATRQLTIFASATALTMAGALGVATTASATTGRATVVPAVSASLTVSGAVAVEYEALGGASGRLGQPITGEISTNGGVVQKFQGGNIYYRSDTGAHPVWSAVYAKWRQYGFESGRLGFPTTNEISTNGGVVQKFQGGNIYYRSDTGAHPVWGGIYGLWRQAGFESGTYGFPTSDEYKNSDGRTRQNFQHGSLYWGTTSTTASTLSTASASTDSQRSTIIATARAQVGKPYVFGAAGPSAFDCSGLTSYAYKSAGITLPRTSAQQGALGTKISASQAKPGDLMWWPGHVAIYAGNGMIYEAATPATGVRYHAVWGSPVYIRVL